MLLGQELKFKNKLCNLKLGTFFSALPGLGASALSGRVGKYLRKFSIVMERRERGIKTKKRPFHKDLYFEVSSGVEPLYTVLQTVT